jgi:multiple sugar transport system substrate-binding protein
MKKLAIALILFASLFAIMACGGETTTTTASQATTSGGTTTSTRITTQTTLDPFWDEDQNGVEDWKEDEITLTYATWQHTTADVVTIESLMANAFMEKYPNITIEFVYAGSGEEWDANFMALLETDLLPDVFLINRLANFLPFNILADITDLYENDPDTDYIFPSVQELGIYDGVRYAVPTFIYPQIWLLNLEILEAAGVAIPGYDWTYEQAEAIAQATTNENTHIIGMYGCDFYHRELPKILKIKAATNADELALANSWLAASYDGFQFNYMDPVFLTAMNDMTEAMQGGYCVSGLDPATLEEWYLDPTFIPTYNGKVAMWREASWSAKNNFSQMLFDWDVYPGPNGVTGGNTDIAGIASTSDNQKAAYQFLKWMSYGEDGLLMRYQLFEDFSEQVTISANNYGYPVVDYGIDGQGVNKIWETIPYGITAPGFVSPEFIESLKNGAFWVNKETVGWDEADTVAYAYIATVVYGTATYADIREILQSEANTAMQNARDALDSLLE